MSQKSTEFNDSFKKMVVEVIKWGKESVISASRRFGIDDRMTVYPVAIKINIRPKGY